MSFSFSDDDIKKFSGILGAETSQVGQSWSWRLQNETTRQSLLLTVSNDVGLTKNKKGTLVSVQTQQGYYELHGCTAFLIFEPDEIIFVRPEGDHVSSLIVGSQCTCSLYSNISRDILSADFSTLDPAVLLSAMQLSLTEEILP